MDPGEVVIGLLILIVAGAGIPAWTMIKLAKIKAAQKEAGSPEVLGRIDALEQEVQGLQHTLAETQERLDFTERMLTQPRDQPKVGP